MYDLQVETGAIDFRELEIFNRDGDLVMESLGTIIEMLNNTDVTAELSAQTLSTLRERANQLLVEQRSLDQKFRITFQTLSKATNLKRCALALPVATPSCLPALLCWVSGF